MTDSSIAEVKLGGPEAGEPEAVLMLHGYGADRLSWTASAPALFSSHAVWALDLPGHGSSSSCPPAPTLEGIANQLASGFMRLAADKPVHLVGHSLGGALCLLLAKLHPHHIASLTLLAPAGLGAGVNAAFMQEFRELQDAESAYTTLQKLMYNPKMVSQQLATMLVRQLDKEGAREALEITAGALATSPPLATTLEGVAEKSMIIWGQQDSINPMWQPVQQGTATQWYTLDSCGHLPHIEHRVRVNRLITSFIAEHSTN